MRILSCSPLELPGASLESAVISPTFSKVMAPVEAILPTITPLEARGNRVITFTFDFQVKSLIYYHTEEYSSGQALLEAMREEPFVRHTLVPEEGLGESTFYEANATRGLSQMLPVCTRQGGNGSSFQEGSQTFGDFASGVGGCGSYRWQLDRCPVCTRQGVCR